MRWSIRTVMLVSLVSVIALVFLVSCKAQKPAATETSTRSAASEKVRITIGTSPSGGAFYSLGTKAAEIISKSVPGYQATAQPSTGPVENVKRMSSGEFDVGYVLTGLAYWAARGEKPFDKPYPVRVLVAGHMEPWVLVVREDSGIRDWRDLKGKRIANAPPGSPLAEGVWNATLEYYKVASKDLALITKVPSLQDTVEQIKARQLDGVFWPTGRGGTSALIDLASSTKVRWIGLGEEASQYVIKRYPFLEKAIVPAGTQEGQKDTYVSVGSRTVIVAMADMDEEVAYNLTKALVEHSDEFRTVGLLGEEWTPENAVASRNAVEYHPGAVKYYRERGLWKD